MGRGSGSWPSSAKCKWKLSHFFLFFSTILSPFRWQLTKENHLCNTHDDLNIRRPQIHFLQVSVPCRTEPMDGLAQAPLTLASWTNGGTSRKLKCGERKVRSCSVSALSCFWQYVCSLHPYGSHPETPPLWLSLGLAAPSSPLAPWVLAVVTVSCCCY